MPYLSSLPADAGLLHIFQAYPDSAQPLLALHEVVMRGPSPLSVGERGMIAAYVSGLNARWRPGMRPVQLHEPDGDGLGVPAIQDNVQLSGARLHDIGYAGLAALLTES